MPVIKQFRPPAQTLAPQLKSRANASHFGGGKAAANQSIAKALTGVADMAFQQAERMEVSDLGAQMAKARADLTLALDKRARSADPGDTQLVDNMNKQAGDLISQIGEGVSSPGGRQFFEQASARLRADINVSATNHQAELSAAKIKQDKVESLSNLSVAVFNDPTSFNSSFEEFKMGTEANRLAGDLTQTQMDAMNHEVGNKLAMQAIRGFTKISPEFADMKLKSGQFDKFLGEDKAKAVQIVEQGIRGASAEHSRKIAEGERLKKEKDNRTQTEFLGAIDKGTLTVDQILSSDLPSFGSGSKDQMIRLIKTNSESVPKTDASVFNSTFERINSGELNDENQLNELLGKGLTLADIRSLRNEMQGKGTEAGKAEQELKSGVFKIAKNALTKSNDLTGITDPIGDVQLQRFNVLFLKTYAEQKKAGKTPQELLDPDSKDYLGGMIKNFVRSNEKIMEDIVKGMSGQSQDKVGPQRNENESAADFLKRIKGDQ